MPSVESFLRDWAIQHGAAPAFAESLVEACPWLDGTSEINPELASELLSDAFALFGLQPELQAFTHAYNEYVLVSSGVRHPTREQAYAAMYAVLQRYGRNSSLDGDCWLVEDSFSTDKPCLVVFDPKFRLHDSALEELASAAKVCPFFSEVLVGDEEGTILQSKVVSHDGG